jgi:hypothetical protein
MVCKLYLCKAVAIPNVTSGMLIVLQTLDFQK